MKKTPAFVSNCMIEIEHDRCFDILTPDERSYLFDNSIEMVYGPDEMVIKQGTFASHILFLQKGLVKVFMGDNNKDLILKIIPENHFVGLSSFYGENHKFIYSVSAYVESKFLLIEESAFRELLKRNPQFAFKILNIQNENTAQVYSRFYCLTRKQSSGLVADLLLCLSKRVFKSDKFHLPITRTDFADLTGLSVESIMRILKEFKRDGLIAVRGKNMEILKTDTLELISQFG
ncbi:MAG: Crp/Fnr family transcriptional regulator [Bacteroidales bacterium]|nr:Crp/Fnr family transcriptional regulator [Bacteroidales bacterium]